MKKITKFSLIGVGLLVSAGILSSCTASFCSLEDTAKILYTMERGVTRYYDEKPTDVPASEIKEHKIGELTYYSHSDIKNSKLLRTTIVPKLVEQNYFVPPMEFFELVDTWVLEEATKGFESTITSVGEISKENTGFFLLNNSHFITYALRHFLKAVCQNHKIDVTCCNSICYNCFHFVRICKHIAC